ncbi:MAG: hypothetical protein ACUVV3_09035 [Dehalococcoidia bacterium]
MKRRLEEALEECLAALAAGESTLEECLALHRELAAELRPLLDTASRLQDACAVDPSPLYAEAARQRFLAAMARRRQTRLVAQPARPFWRWAPVAVGSAALVALVAWASVLALGGGGGGSEGPPAAIDIDRTTPISTPTSTPVSTPAPVVSDIEERVARVQAQLEEIRTGAETGAVEPVVIQQMKEDTAALVESLGETEVLEPEAVSQIGELLADQEKVLSEVKEKVSPEAAEDVDEIIRIAGEGRAKVEQILAPTATPTAVPTATPSASPSATPTVPAEESPTPTATPSETPTAEATPTETPQPTPSPSPEGGEGSVPAARVAP